MSTTHHSPAFPSIWANEGDMNATSPDGQLVPPDGVIHMQGMTLRDYFAAKAMQALVAGPELTDIFEHIDTKDQEQAVKDAVARNSYSWANAMLKARGNAP